MPTDRNPVADFEIALRRQHVTDELYISLLKELAAEWLLTAKANSGHVSVAELTKTVLTEHHRKLARAFETFHSIILNGGHVIHNRDMHIEVP